jgi:SAM-dependent methyltransferase
MLAPVPPEATGRRCPACEGALGDAPLIRGVDRLHGTPGEFEVVGCEVCGSAVTLPPATPEQLAAAYPAGYGPYEATIGPIAASLSRWIRSYQGRRALTQPPLSALRTAPPGQLVDVGCGRGDLAAMFVERGWRAVGIEPSAAACEAARGRGVEAREGTLSDVELDAETYDAALFRHSLEHTPDPAGDLAKIRAALRPGGLVLVTVPNFGSWQRHRFHDSWFHLDLPRHRTHFTAAGLRAILARTGFAVQSVTTSTSTVGLPGTLQYALFGRCLFPQGLSLRVAVGLCVIGLPLARIVDALIGAGDQLDAVARRRG